VEGIDERERKMEGYAWGSGRDRRTRGGFGWVKRKKRVKKKRDFQKRLFWSFFMVVMGYIVKKKD